MSEKSLQELLFPALTCFGCGPANPRGLGLRSYPGEGGVVVASFTPWPEHDNGFGFLNGGIISTLLDCHTAAVVVGEATSRGWFQSDPSPYATAGIDVRFLRPTPLAAELELWAKAESMGEQESIIVGELRHGGKVRASVRAIWKRQRPR